MIPQSIRIMLVDDHNVVRIGLASLFGTVAHFTVVGEAASVAAAVAEARQTQPDIVIMDVRLPDGSGVEACREIRSFRPQTRVIMLTSYSDEDAILDSILAGAAGYLLKQIEPTRLIEAVDEVAKGGSLLDPAVTQTVLAWMRRHGTQDPADPLATLSDHERKILPLIAAGKTNREIATALYLTENTIKTYVSNILQKLRLSRRAEAAAFIARRQGASET